MSDSAQTLVEHANHSPMHQFEIAKIKGLDFSFLGIDLSITNATIAMFGIVILLIVCLSALVSKLDNLPGKKQAFAEILYNFIKGLVTANISNPKNTNFIPLIRLRL
jgi:F0F1-type ATP synthase membrane subunit a